MARIICAVLSILGIGLAAVLSAPSESCSCGKKKNNNTRNETRPKVIKGEDADLNEYPWMVYTANGCGGVVINSKWVLTAGHCAEEEVTWWAILGEWDVTNELETESRKDFDIVNTVRHPDVDLALVEVEGDIDLSIYTPICLPKPGFDVRGKRVTLAGWGQRCGHDCHVECEDIDRTKNILQEADIPVPSNEECGLGNRDYICYGAEDGKSSCNGDSGSPVIYNDNDKWTLVAVHSAIFLGTGCDESSLLSGECILMMGAEVEKFVEWIEDNTKGSTSCKD